MIETLPKNNYTKSETATASVSVVIPTHKTNMKYFLRCFDSLKNQTFGDFELICVDDSSTDNSAEIIKQYNLKDNRIKYSNNKITLEKGDKLFIYTDGVTESHNILKELYTNI